jgi:hypothetical protein
VSISSVLNPSVLASQIAGKNPLAAAAVQGAASFGSTLLQALQQTGTGAASTASVTSTASGASTAAAGTAAGAVSAAHGHHHGHHHGAGMSARLQSLLQQTQSGSTGGPGQILNTAA